MFFRQAARIECVDLFSGDVKFMDEILHLRWGIFLFNLSLYFYRKNIKIKVSIYKHKNAYKNDT